jgi:hypothetical protein
VDAVLKLDEVAMDVAWGNDVDKADFVPVLYRACPYRPDLSGEALDLRGRDQPPARTWGMAVRSRRA